MLVRIIPTLESNLQNYQKEYKEKYSRDTFASGQYMFKTKLEKKEKILLDVKEKCMEQLDEIEEQESVLRTTWEQIQELLTWLRYEKYIDDQIEISEIWEICEALVKHEELQYEKWELKKSILSEMIENGTIFVVVDFSDISHSSRVGVVLTRLESEGLIRRIMRGVYEKPLYNNFLGEYVAASPNKIAEALARNFGWTIVPCGDIALNLLGLSTQVPASWIYVSDEPYKEYTYGNITINFKRTTNKEISKLSYKTALVVQALKALGKENVDDTILEKLKITLTSTEKKAMLTEAKAATSWIYEYIKQICKGDEK